MLAAEAGWTNLNLTHLENQGKKNEVKKKKEEEEEEEGGRGLLDPPSNSLTQTDRDYFNMVRTEDGKSGFFLDKKLAKHSSQLASSRSSTTTSHMLPAFLFHQTLEGGGGRPIVGIYLSKPP